MKKILGIVVLGLLFCGNTYAKNLKIECNFITKTNMGKDFISYVFIDIKNKDAFLEIKDNFTVKKNTTWNLKVSYEENYMIIKEAKYGEAGMRQPDLRINRYTMVADYYDHQGNTHNGKCTKLKRAI